MLCLLLLLLIPNCPSAREIYPKCCDSDSVLQTINSSYFCIPDLTHRTQIIANETNFVNKSEEGYCVDVEKAVSLFRFDGNEVLKVREVTVEFYPKCCPVDYFYNSRTHGCVKSPKKLDTFFHGKFVRVGLPHCGTIEDLNMSTIKQWNESLQIRENKTFDEGLYCVDKDENSLFIARVCRDDYICRKIRCVYKCCPDGQSFINASNCYDTYVHGLDFSAFAVNVDNLNDNFAVVHGFPRPLFRHKSPKFQFDRNEDGTFTLIKLDEKNVSISRSYIFDPSMYCIEHAATKTINNFYLFQGPVDDRNIKFWYTRVAMAISCIFLTLTILYYCISDEKQKVFGRILMSYCSALFLFYIHLCLFAFKSTHPTGTPFCTSLAFLLLYLNLSIFTWVNMMCIDIYWTFGSSKSFAGRQPREKNVKRFLLYSLYAWGSPLILTVLSLIFYHLKVLPGAVQLVVDKDKCLMWNGNYGRFMFSTVPLAVLEVCNLILFIRTVVHCLQVKREIDKINDTRAKGEKQKRFNTFKDRFGLLLKLFIVMGISFLFEVVSTFYDFKASKSTAIIEQIWDIFNCLHGLFIFIIFLLKKKTLEKLRVITKFSNSTTDIVNLP